MKTHANSLTNYLGSELISVAYLSLSEETCKVWVETISFSRITFKLASCSNPQKLVLLQGCDKRRKECLCFSEYCIHWNTKILYWWVKITVSSGVSSLFGKPVYRFERPRCDAQKHFLSFLFAVVFQRKIHWISDQWFPSASSYFETAWETKMQPQEQNNETKRRWSKRRNRLRKSFHSFKYETIDHANIRLFILIIFANLLLLIKWHK